MRTYSRILTTSKIGLMSQSKKPASRSNFYRDVQYGMESEHTDYEPSLSGKPQIAPKSAHCSKSRPEVAPTLQPAPASTPTSELDFESDKTRPKLKPKPKPLIGLEYETNKADDTTEASVCASSTHTIRRMSACRSRNMTSYRSGVIEPIADIGTGAVEQTMRSNDGKFTNMYPLSGNSTCSGYSNQSDVSMATDEESLITNLQRMSMCSTISSLTSGSDFDDYDTDFDGWPSDEFSDDEDHVYEEIKDCDTKVILQEGKRRHVAMELMTTETSYVASLFTVFKASIVIDGANKMKRFLPDNFRSQMFPCIETFYRLHNDFILPALRARMTEWNTKPYLSDIWKEYLPFLTSYKLYMSQLNTATDLIRKTKESSSDFTGLMRDIEKGDGFKKLNLESLLLEPVQRLPRYRLLLQSYLKYLTGTENTTELHDIEDIFDTLGKLAADCEKTLKEKDMFGDFSKIQDRIEDLLSVLNPQAKLLIEGECTEITSSTHKKQLHRYLFLFSDFLLICSPRLLGNKLVIRKRLEVTEMRIRPSSHLNFLNYDPDLTMTIKARESSVDLLFTDEATKCNWEEMLLYVICNALKSSLEKRNLTDELIVRGNNANFQRAPVMIHDDKSDVCMVCGLRFQTLTRRRHHCRGCGIVACAKCCSQRIALPYMNEDIGRVCHNCFLRARRDCPELTRRISTKRPTRVNVSRKQPQGASNGAVDDVIDSDVDSREASSFMRRGSDTSGNTVSLEEHPTYSEMPC